MLLFSVPRLGTVAVNLLAPLTSSGSAVDWAVPAGPGQETAVDFRPEGSWTWEGYTFSIPVQWWRSGRRPEALYLLKITHPQPLAARPALGRDLGGGRPGQPLLFLSSGQAADRPGYFRVYMGMSSGNPSASYPFASYYDMGYPHRPFGHRDHPPF